MPKHSTLNSMPIKETRTKSDATWTVHSLKFCISSSVEFQFNSLKLAASLSVFSRFVLIRSDTFHLTMCLLHPMSKRTLADNDRMISQIIWPATLSTFMHYWLHRLSFDALNNVISVLYGLSRWVLCIVLRCVLLYELLLTCLSHSSP